MEKSLSCSSPSLFISWFIPFSDDHLNASSKIHQKNSGTLVPISISKPLYFQFELFSKSNSSAARLLPIFLHQRLARQTSGSKSITVPQNPKQSENSPKPFLAPSYNFLILPRSCSPSPTSLQPNLFWVFAETYHKTYLIYSNHVLPPFLFNTSHSSRHLAKENTPFPYWYKT